MEVIYHPKAVQDIRNLDLSIKIKIKKAIETKLAIKPEIYGEPLRGSLRPYWKLRVGDWRIIFSASPEKVKIFLIRHRRDVYLEARKRI